MNALTEATRIALDQAAFADNPDVNTPRSRPRVYALEDDPSFSAQIAETLLEFGYQPSVFDSPDSLLAAAADIMPDVLMIDVALPAGPTAGLDFLHGAPDSLRKLPTIVITSRSDIEARLAAVRAGADAYFTKPVSIPRLVDRLDDLTHAQRIEPHRVVALDDDPHQATWVKHTLEAAGIRTQAILDPKDLLAAIHDHHPDVLVLDLQLDSCSGVELAQVVRADSELSNIPILFLSTETELTRQAKALESGGDSFLTIPVDPTALVGAIHGLARRIRSMRRNMNRDGLTGLNSHSALKQQLAREVARAKRDQTTVTYVMIDVDHFKSVNDAFGHVAGDRVLKALSRALREGVRNADVVGRYGGEEFALVLPGASEPEGAKRADDVRDLFSRLRFVSPSGETFAVTFSAGVASFPKHTSPEALILAADAALYRAKEAGRNQVMIDL